MFIEGAHIVKKFEEFVVIWHKTYEYRDEYEEMSNQRNLPCHKRCN